jgi:hypothetical protein
MKNWLYDNISDLGESLIVGCEILTSFLIDILTSVSDWFIFCIASIFKLALWFVDQERTDHAQHVVDQTSLNTELEILMNVTRVKEDALEKMSWTTHHSLALNELSSQLYNQCNWDRVRIHDYMRAIVESIPGLSYVATEEDEDDDSIGLEG